MKKILIFDWDDTFTLNSKGGYFACLRAAINEVGVFLDPEEEEQRILSKWGRPHEEELGALLTEQPELVSAACEVYEKHFFGDTFVDALGYVDGANELLERLVEKYILTLATGAHPQVLRERVMPKFNTPDVFVQTISGYDITDPANGKPSPYMVEQILQTHGCTPEEAVVIGDSASDMKMAQNAGVDTVTVLTGNLTKEQAEELGVEYIIPDVTHLEVVLTALEQ